MCFEHVAYFVGEYVQIYDAVQREWIPFGLWPEQARTLSVMLRNLLVVILKARQLGLTWLVLAYALWLMLYRPAATVLLFSRRDDEAVHLLDFRLKGMYQRLPDWMKNDLVTEEDSKHVFRLSNGSVAYAFPTTAGDSYTATLAIVDEADLVPDLDRLMTAVKPTIDNGGSMILLSRADKSRPLSTFKKIYRAARDKLSSWVSVFLPWHVHPARDAAWYERQMRDVMGRTGSLDDLHEQYPATDAEALSPRTLDKRIPYEWLERCYVAMEPIKEHDGPAVPGFVVYRLPEEGRQYVIGADPAEGNPTSDESSLSVLDQETGEEVAGLAGRFQPDTFAGYIDEVGYWFNEAGALVERNNHGHAVLLWLRNFGRIPILQSNEDEKDGWLSNGRGKSLLYSKMATGARDGEVIIHGEVVFTQLASIEGGTLRAPKDEPDDRADGYALAHMARALSWWTW